MDEHAEATLERNPEAIRNYLNNAIEQWCKNNPSSAKNLDLPVTEIPEKVIHTLMRHSIGAVKANCHPDKNSPTFPRLALKRNYSVLGIFIRWVHMDRQRIFLDHGIYKDFVHPSDLDPEHQFTTYNKFFKDPWVLREHSYIWPELSRTYIRLLAQQHRRILRILQHWKPILHNPMPLLPKRRLLPAKYLFFQLRILRFSDGTLPVVHVVKYGNIPKHEFSFAENKALLLTPWTAIELSTRDGELLPPQQELISQLADELKLPEHLKQDMLAGKLSMKILNPKLHSLR